MHKKFGIFISLLILFVPVIVFATVGVGVSLGKIELDEPLKPGILYKLPVLPVLNTGDEPGEYGVSIEYRQNQPQMSPAREWFSFNPSLFHLEPGESQSVAIMLTLPLKTKPGDYFAFLSAHPVEKTGPGTSIGIAAAAKLYFTVAPANIWQGISYRISSFFRMYAPWPWVVLAIVAGAIAIVVFRKYFAFQLGIKRKE